MASYRNPRNKKEWYFRKRMKHPLTGEKVELHGGPFKSQSVSDDAESAEIVKLKAPAKVGVPTFDDWFNGRFWTEWVLGSPRGANSPSEQEAKRLIYDKWLKTFFGSLSLDRIDVERINTFRAGLRAKKQSDGVTPVLKEKTINNILAVLSTPLRYAEKAGVIMKAPFVGVAKVERPEIEFIEFEEVSRLCIAAAHDMHPWMKIAVLLVYEAGLRIGEVRALRWTAIDMKGKTITVSEQIRTVGSKRDVEPEPVEGVKVGKLSYVDVKGKPKGRRRRMVSMSPALYEALRDCVRVGYVVSVEPEKPVTKEMVRCGIERVAKAAKLEDRVSGWHIGRHTFATHAALLGVNPWLLQEWMGHIDPKETQGYADVARAHGRTIPPSVLSAGAKETDPARRLLAQLSARLELAKDFVPTNCQQSEGTRR